MKRIGEETQFQKRVKEAISASKYSRISLCNELHITKDAFDRYMKTGAHLPNLDIIRNIARLLDVDVGYLLGDYDYPKIAPLKASELLGLSEDACNVIKKDLMPHSFSKETFEKLITNSGFPNLLAEIYKYSRSYSQKVTSSDRAGVFDDEIFSDESSVTDIRIKESLSQFKKILEALYKEETPKVKALLVENLVKELINFVYEFCHTHNSKDTTLRKLLEAHITSLQNEIKQHAPNNNLANLSADYIIENISFLYGSISNSEEFPVEYMKMISIGDK